jgi:hypothetical protein
MNPMVPANRPGALRFRNITRLDRAGLDDRQLDLAQNAIRWRRDPLYVCTRVLESVHCARGHYTAELALGLAPGLALVLAAAWAGAFIF